MYEIKVKNITYLKGKPVIKGKLVLLGEDKLPICVSNTEKIRQDDWVYHRSKKQLFKVGRFGKCNGSKSFNPVDAFELATNEWKLVADCDKVLALPEHFTEQILEVKLTNENKFFLECEKIRVNQYGFYGIEFKIKHDKFSNIIPHAIKRKVDNVPKECAIATFYIDSVTNRPEGEFIENKNMEIGNINLWSSPKLTDKRIKYAFGKENVEKLYREWLVWQEPEKTKEKKLKEL